MNRTNRINIVLLLVIIFTVTVSNAVTAQTLLDRLEKEIPADTSFTIATFKTTRLSIGHTVETRKKGVLEISANTSFWNIPNLESQSFVADKLNTRFGLNYAISNRLSAEFGGSTWDGVLDGLLKYRLVKQAGPNKNYFNITLLQGGSVRTKRMGMVSGFDNFSDKISLTSQFLMARKFNQNLSLQLSPTYIYRGSTLSDEDPTHHFAIGFGGRHKVGNHVSIVSEYYLLTNPLESITTYNAFALGLNWEMSDLMLQFRLTNARNLVENLFITETRNNFNFDDGNFHFGFNATYIIHFRKKKK